MKRPIFRLTNWTCLPSRVQIVLTGGDGRRSLKLIAQHLTFNPSTGEVLRKEQIITIFLEYTVNLHKLIDQHLTFYHSHVYCRDLRKAKYNTLSSVVVKVKVFSMPVF